MDVALESIASFEQYVLLSVVELSVDEETPAHSYEVAQTAKARLDALDRAPFGGIERQEVITALASLSEDDLLEKATTESAAGKGRPAYNLDVAPEEVLTTLSGDDEVGSYAESLTR